MTTVFTGLITALKNQGYAFSATALQANGVQGFWNTLLPGSIQALADKFADDQATAGEEMFTTIAEHTVNKALLGGVDVPFVGALAHLFARHHVDPNVIEEVLQRLNAMSLFSCIRYRECAELFVCLKADDLHLNRAKDVSSVIDSINVNVLSLTSKPVTPGLSEKWRAKLHTGVGYAVIMFVYEHTPNPAVLSSVLRECKNIHHGRGQYTLPLAMVISERRIHKYPGFPPRPASLKLDELSRDVFGA